MLFTKKKEKDLKDEIALLKYQIEDLKQIIKTQELMKLRAENERLREKDKLISKIKFRLKDVAYLSEENVILVKYDFPFLKVSVNAEGHVEKNEMFYSINKLQLLPFEDMKKIQAVIDEVAVRNQKK